MHGRYNSPDRNHPPGEESLIEMTKTFDVLAESPLRTDDFGEGEGVVQFSDARRRTKQAVFQTSL